MSEWLRLTCAPMMDPPEVFRFIVGRSQKPDHDTTPHAQQPYTAADAKADLVDTDPGLIGNLVWADRPDQVLGRTVPLPPAKVYWLLVSQKPGIMNFHYQTLL